MKDQKDLRTMKKEVNWFENQRKKLYKKLRNCEMTDFGGQLD